MPGFPPGAQVPPPPSGPGWPLVGKFLRDARLSNLDALLPGMHRDAIMQRGGRDIETIGKRMCKGAAKM